MNVWDYERAFEQTLDAGAFGYFTGGANDEVTLRDNVAAFRRWRLRPRMLVDVSAASIETTVLGTPVSMPLLVAPTAFQRMAHPDGEPATARAAAAAGIVMTLSTAATTTPAEVAEAAPGAARWFQLYWFKDEGVTRALVDQAAEAGFRAIVLTTDAPGTLGRRERDLRTGFTVEAPIPAFAAASGRRSGAAPAEMFDLIEDRLTWRDLERLRGMSDLPLVVKGLLTREDARLAVDAGVDGIVVSNHAGRQLDTVLAGIDALPEVVDEVAGEVEVFVDGGVRRGTDVLKALALGARAAMVGRPVLWGLAAAGEEGVRDVLEMFRREIALGMRLLGCAGCGSITRAHVQRGPDPG
ncbi:MAG TPA: alpha-hydroxy acid oxidase [Thermoleophilaceae bacterium]|nr:alpha-hydroxy acid oxidase [Thermoleophilaceae bacterium]